GVPCAHAEFILPSKLAPQKAGTGLPAPVPPGLRAVSVRVNEVVAVVGFVTPGTRVDVLLTGTPAGGTDPQTTTVLQNVAVIAAGHTLERSVTGDAQSTPVITLLVSPDDAQKLTLASTEGHIQLALRNPLDTKQDDLASVKTGALYRTLVAPDNAPAAKPRLKRVTVAAPPPPSVYTIEMIRGTK